MFGSLKGYNQIFEARGSGSLNFFGVTHFFLELIFSRSAKVHGPSQVECNNVYM